MTHTQAALYADDTALLIAHHSLQEAELLANNELEVTSQWFKRNKLLLNTKKTKYVVFASNRKVVPEACGLYIGGNAIEKLNAHTYLGVTLDSSFHWATHIDHLCKKLSFGCFTLFKARKYFNLQTLRILYFNIFHSHLTYCIESWGYTYASYSSVVSILQKRAVRTIASAPKNAPSTELFRNLNIMPFNVVRQYKSATLVHKIIYKNIPYHSSVLVKPRCNTRQAEQKNLNLPVVHNVYGRRSISYVGAKIWNNIPSSIKCLPNIAPSLKRLFLSESYQSPY